MKNNDTLEALEITFRGEFTARIQGKDIAVRIVGNTGRPFMMFPAFVDGKNEFGFYPSVGGGFSTLDFSRANDLNDNYAPSKHGNITECLEEILALNQDRPLKAPGSPLNGKLEPVMDSVLEAGCLACYSSGVDTGTVLFIDSDGRQGKAWVRRNELPKEKSRMYFPIRRTHKFGENVEFFYYGQEMNVDIQKLK